MKSPGELNLPANKYGWKVEPLTFAKVQRMTADESAWHALNDKAELEKALNEPAVRKQKEDAALVGKAARHSTTATPEDLSESLADLDKLAKTYPQFVQVESNCLAIMDWLKAKNLPFTYEYMVRAFEAQTTAGQLMLNPSAIGAGTETEVTGFRLARHPQLWKLLATHTPETRKREDLNRMPADAVLPQINKLWQEQNGAQTPAFIKRDFRRYEATFCAHHPEFIYSEENKDLLAEHIVKYRLPMSLAGMEMAYTALREAEKLEINHEAVVTAGATKMIDFGAARSTGHPARSSKSSFQSKIDSMTSTELREKMAIDPSFREALDGLG